jgi:hypothetical protein
MPDFAHWESFYVVVGAAAGALIGLQFVVMTLIAEKPPLRQAEAGAAFATPTIVHFSAALLLSALLRAPWHSIAPAAVLWGLVGFVGVGYMVIVTHRMRVQTAYRPELQDWLAHAILPMLGYAVLGLTALAATSNERGALFGVGAATLLLLFVGIHNAWDSVVYLTTHSSEPQPWRFVSFRKRT